ncbi:T9SS type A sorting domain-containing protein, partial [Candidatus Poribacteria bacterium]|nr:T9SS type A sorting domain-containing protein [Candidatus Poribacteria bacterium]
TEVTITIYNSQGHHIRTLELGTQPANSYLVKDRAAYWDGYSHIGERVSSGIYYYHFQAGDFAATKKMIILK